MNILVTILQCRRVALPYLFIQHSLPMMRGSGAGHVTVHLVQHESNVTGFNPHATSRLAPTKQRLVEDWTRSGRYAGARVIRHAEQLPQYPSIPSRRIALECAAAETYDWHLWLEDDAFVFDRDWLTWSDRLAGSLVGAFRSNAFGYVNAAYYVSSPEHDALLLPELACSERWDLQASMYAMRGGQKLLDLNAPRIEPTITRLAGGRVGRLNPGAAARHNPRNDAAVVELSVLLREVCPLDMKLLSLDFPEVFWR